MRAPSALDASAWEVPFRLSRCDPAVSTSPIDTLEGRACFGSRGRVSRRRGKERTGGAVTAEPYGAGPRGREPTVSGRSAAPREARCLHRCRWLEGSAPKGGERVHPHAGEPSCRPRGPAHAAQTGERCTTAGSVEEGGLSSSALVRALSRTPVAPHSCWPTGRDTPIPLSRVPGAPGADEAS